MQKQETKAVTVKAPAEMEIPKNLQGAWGAETADSTDIIVPKILLMHGQSDKVLKGLRNAGEIIRSSDSELLAKRDGTLKMIPFQMAKLWRLSYMEGKKRRILREEDWSAANDKLPNEFQEKDPKTGQMRDCRRDRTYRFFVLLDGETFPSVMEFTRTSLFAGKNIADHFVKSGYKNLPPARAKFEIGSEFKENAENKFFVFTAKVCGASTLQELQECFDWNETFKKKPAVVVDEEEETAEYKNIPF